MLMCLETNPELIYYCLYNLQQMLSSELESLVYSTYLFV